LGVPVVARNTDDGSDVQIEFGPFIRSHHPRDFATIEEALHA
jgi:hypothetical protein